MSALAPQRPRPAPAATWGGTAAPPRCPANAWLGAAIVVALALRLPFVWVALGVDEGGIAHIARAWGSAHGSLYGASWLDRPPVLVALFRIAVLGGDLGVRVLGAVAAVSLVVVVTLGARLVAGDRAGAIGGVLTALMTGSLTLGAVYTPGELLAAVPAAASVSCLVAARRGRGDQWLFGAGLLAVGAVLVKQSFLDAGVAGAAFLCASCLRERRFLGRRIAAYAAGAALPLLGVAAWQTAVGLPLGSLPYALFGFRLDALRILATSTIPLPVRLEHLFSPAMGSGLIVVLPAALLALPRLRRDVVLMAALAAWLVAGMAGVLAGGSYWPHYLIQLIAPCSILAGVLLAGTRPTIRRGVLTTTAIVVLVVCAVGAVRVRQDPPHRAEVAVGRYVRSHARPGDTQYVLYARANVGYYSGLRSPYPYAWSLMVRAVPGAPQRLQRLLASPQRPTWVVEWQSPDRWNVDARGAIARALATRYRHVATVCGHRIDVRRDRARRPRRIETIPCPAPAGTPHTVRLPRV